jgi:type II secretory pathway pseudopilin PulG
MKLTKTATKIKPGMTLIEITVVILVLLTLISVLFIGANVYKNGADRAACILNIRNIHQAVRADQNLTGNVAGSAVTSLAGNLYGGGLYFETAPTCPKATGAYTMASDTAYPAIGTVAVTCATDGAAGSNAAGALDHFPANTGGW